MSNPSLKILPVLMVAVTALVTTRAVFGADFNELIITETSSTSLTAIYDGQVCTVVNIGPDLWTLTLPDPFLASFLPFGWSEPENVNNFNVLFLTPGVADSLSVASDVSGFSGNSTGNGDSAVTMDDVQNGSPIVTTFIDNAATSEPAVPDTGTTASLFGLSLVGLGFLRRKLC